MGYAGLGRKGSRGGGGGGGGLLFRTPADIFTGADLPACRTARNVYFVSSTNAEALSQFRADQFLAIVLNPANSTNNVFETYLPGNSDGLRQIAKEFALHSANTSARGMTVSATHAYVIDDSTERVNVYQLSDGARQTAQEFAIHSSNSWPVGIAVNAIDAYVADNADNKLFVYQLSDGARQTAKEFALHSDNFRPSGVAVDATYAYVADLDDHKMYVYQLSDGARQAGREFDFDTDNTNPQGIAVDATYAYVVDQADGKVYVYRLSDGARIKGQEFGLDPANANARGIGVTATYAYVVDFDDVKVYAYRLHGSYDSTKWLARTDAVQGNPGAGGSQGIYERSIYRNSSAIISVAPVGGSINVGTGVVTPPADWTFNPTAPVVGEDTYRSTVSVNPNSQSGDIVPVWSLPIDIRGSVNVADIDARISGPALAINPVGTFDDLRIPSSIARDTEVTAAIAGIMASGAINLGIVTPTSDRLTAAAPSGYSRYPKGTLLLFKPSYGQLDSSWTGTLDFYIGTDRYDLVGDGTSDIRYSNLVADTYYLAVVDTAVQILGPVKSPVSISIAEVLAKILSGTGIGIDTSVDDQITLSSPVQTGTQILAALLTVDGANSGLDADLLDGMTPAEVAALASASGFTMRSDAGAPAQALGDDGDWYINRTTGGFYEKVSGTWELRYTDQVGAAGGLTQDQVDARADARIAVALAAAVIGNTETGIVVTYNSDGTFDFVIQAAAQTHTNYVGIIDGELSAVVIADFTVSGITEALTIPAYSGTRRLLFARPASEADPSAVYLYQSGNRNTVNQISTFVKSNTSIQLGGEAHNWWGTADLQNGAGEYVLEQVN